MAFEYLAAYATFESVADMDKSVEDHMAIHYYGLTKSERAVVLAIQTSALAYPGACHLKNETIAKEIDVSLITVSRAISKLVKLGIIGKANRTKKNGIKGANIYFFLPHNDVSEMMQRVTTDEANNDAVSPPQSENQSLKSFNLLSSKQANNIISVSEELALQAEKKKEFMNEYQTMLFDFLHSLPMRDGLKDQLYKVVLASQIECPRGFVRAKDVLLNIVRDINSGVLTISSTLRATFKGAYNKAVERLGNMKVSTSTVEDKAGDRRPVPVYDWLNNRDCRPQSISSKPIIDNWLDW